MTDSRESIDAYRGGIAVHMDIKSKESLDWTIKVLTAMGDVVFSSDDLFDVVLLECGEQKLSVIKEIRTLTGLGLHTVLPIVDKPNSIVLSGVTHSVALAAQRVLHAQGATVAINPSARSTT